MSQPTYAERLKDPRWQRRRLEILQRSDFSCECCGSKEKTLHVHHKIYRSGAMPWEYGDHELMALCEDCHSWYHQLKDMLAEAICQMSMGELAELYGYSEGVLDAKAARPSRLKMTRVEWTSRGYNRAYPEKA